MASLYGPPPIPLTSVVTTTADGGIGSLRAAIYHAQDHPGTTVTFNIPPSDPGFADGVFTIKLTDNLPPLATNGMTIDASTQPGYAGKPLVFLNGSKILPEAGFVSGLLFYEANSTVKTLGFQEFPWNGVSMLYPEATGNRIIDCSCGVDGTGDAAKPNLYRGILIADGARGNSVEGSQVSGNTQYGVGIFGATTTGNKLLGNRIGTNHAGTAALPNVSGGVGLGYGANENIIGGHTVAARNVISGNTNAGVWITGTGASRNEVRGNYIGLNAAGTAALPNTFAGLNILSGATDNLVAGNVISGNSSEGMRIADGGTSLNRIQGNRIGTSPAGDSAIPNGFTGIAVYGGPTVNDGGATLNRIGGTEPGQGNLISGNGTVGLVFGGPGVQDNRAFGNFIGTDATGMAAIPNGFAGVYMTDRSAVNYLGDGPGTGNLVSGNGQIGVLVADFGTGLNYIRNNRIGPNAAGGLTFTNQADGIRIQFSSQSTRVGGTTPGAPNIISGNSSCGIAMFDSPTAGHTFERNSIHGNGWQGIALFAGSNHGQVAPQLTAAVLSTGTAVSGSLNVTAGVNQFVIEFFASPGARDFIGKYNLTTDVNGPANFNVTLPATVAAGREIIATATFQATGDTSQFSDPVTVTSVDGDADGLPDAYESSTPGLSPANALDAALDNDLDGFTNFQEFVAGTHPNNSTSRLVTTGAMAGGGFQITLETVAGKSYRVERSDSLPGSWETVALHVEGTGSPVQVLVPVTLSNPRQFFRVTAGD